jgi:hypothetical protein
MDINIQLMVDNPIDIPKLIDIRQVIDIMINENQQVNIQ